MSTLRQKARYEVIDPAEHAGKKYRLLEDIRYHSKRYGTRVYCPVGMLSDGATGAHDIETSISWWVHDRLCEDACFLHGEPCTAWMASMVLRDILKDEGHGIRARFWTWATFLFGSWINKARAGWFRLRKEFFEEGESL